MSMIIENTIQDRLDENDEDELLALQLTFQNDGFVLVLEDGRRQKFPYTVSPRLTFATEAERRGGVLIMNGYGIEWEALDEHLSVSGLMAGRTSSEAWTSVQKWLAGRETVLA